MSHSRGSSTSLATPVVTKPETIHVILEVEDRGTPSLFARRRAVISLKPYDRAFPAEYIIREGATRSD